MIPPLELSLDECVDPVSGGVVGRVAMASAAGPELAFEVDHVAYETQQGWSVVALGKRLVARNPAALSSDALTPTYLVVGPAPRPGRTRTPR
jgi:hypothetical protein